MRNNDELGSRAHDSSDWSSAFEAVSRLAAAREASLQSIERERRDAVPREPAGIPASKAVTASEGIAISNKPAVDPDQLARAVAEIEKESAALRRSETALEVWRPGSTTLSEARSYGPVWLLIGGIWISATLVVAGTAAAILYLFG